MAAPAVEVEEDATVLQLKQNIEMMTAIGIGEQELYHQNSVLRDDGVTLKDAGVKNNDVVHVREKSQHNKAQEEQRFLDQLNAQPQLLDMLPPHLRARIQARDASALQETIAYIQAAQAAKQYEEIEALNADEFDPEAQAKIAERIRQANIDANWNAALEHSPEVFGEIKMLYVNMMVNNKPLKTFVDSGAQACIMSLKCAEECNIAHLIDKRYQGVLQGVGTQKMYGRVHSVEVTVGSQRVPMAVTVVEESSVDLLFGLDMLRRYRCCIDLDKNCLRFTTLDDVSLEFLPDHEIPNQKPAASLLTAAGPAAEAARSVPAVAAGTPKAPTDVGPSKPAAPASKPVTQAAPSKEPTKPVSGSGSADQEAKVQQLMSLGFPRQMCEEALKVCNGSADHAASLLFSQM